MRTIKELVNKDIPNYKKKEKVYVYLANEEIGKKFMQQAEDEGFLFGDGAKPTSRCYAEVMAVNDDITINFVNSIGRMAFSSGTSSIGDKTLIRVDFEKYIAGEENYIYNGKH